VAVGDRIGVEAAFVGLAALLAASLVALAVVQRLAGP
jgi:hypothetical protein